VPVPVCSPCNEPHAACETRHGVKHRGCACFRPRVCLGCFGTAYVQRRREPRPAPPTCSSTRLPASQQRRRWSSSAGPLPQRQQLPCTPYPLVRAHPFGDGNGRMGRLLMNLLLVRGGYLPYC